MREIILFLVIVLGIVTTAVTAGELPLDCDSSGCVGELINKPISTGQTHTYEVTFPSSTTYFDVWVSENDDYNTGLDKENIELYVKKGKGGTKTDYNRGSDHVNEWQWVHSETVSALKSDCGSNYQNQNYCNTAEAYDYCCWTMLGPSGSNSFDFGTLAGTYTIVIYADSVPTADKTYDLYVESY